MSEEVSSFIEKQSLELAKLSALKTKEQELKDAYERGLKDGAPKWVSVDTRLPELGEPVLLMSIYRWDNRPDDKNVFTVGFLDNVASVDPYWCVRYERVTAINTYTHWCELPAPPKEEE